MILTNTAFKTGSDICGFNGNTNPELCRRWLQLGAFYPFSRSHNGYGSSDQDPGYFAEIGHPEVTNSAVESLRIRYQMLHYLYTGMFISHTRGDPLVQSVMVLNPHNSNVLKYDHLYMLGESVLVAPFLNIVSQQICLNRNIIFSFCRINNTMMWTLSKVFGTR